jgi:hypothetical protein
MTIFDPPGLTLERDKRAEPRKKATTKILLRNSQHALTMMGNGWTTEAIEHTHQSTISLLACFMRGDKDVQYATFQEKKEGLNHEDSVTSLACLSRLFKHVSTLT